MLLKILYNNRKGLKILTQKCFIKSVTNSNTSVQMLTLLKRMRLLDYIIIS